MPTKSKLTLNVDKDLLRDAKGITSREGVSVSSIVEETLEAVVVSRSLDRLASRLGLTGLLSIDPDALPRLRPKGLDAGRAVREVRNDRERRLTR